MKKQLAKTLVGGMILGSVLTVGVGYASQYVESIKVNTKPLTITLNGNTIVSGDQANQFHNGMENVPVTFQYKGTTYVPIGFMTKEFNKNVAWDGSTRTIAITDNNPHGIWVGRLEPSLTETSAGKYTYSVKNQTEREVRLEFTSSQRYDFAVKNSKGETVYLYSSLASFAQVLGEEVIKQGEALSYEIDTTALGLEKGDYTLEAWLTPRDGKTASVEVSFVVK
ncbi:BsuPI-related putative proteinase inhibitor [Cohnella pontilimi]|uniref:BsuPI-related putative proteinase inhibitor n=1 Tax=Cohnella pontilimi TaxID=2564100 RepID=UPI00145E658A|nr:BsuPI-related putative proteinase inhibitor [Cohnella pontilimi]